jgi:hypothetical protein
LPITVRTTVAVAKFAMPGTMKCLRARENVILKTEKLLLIWISDQEAKGDNVNSKLIRKKAKRIFYKLKVSLYQCLFTKKNFSAEVHDFSWNESSS